MDSKLLNHIKDVQDELRTLDKLKESFGVFSNKPNPINYRQSYFVLMKDYKLWKQACWRTLNRYKRAVRLLSLAAPELIVHNEAIMLGEAIKYLSYCIQGFSFRLFFEFYKPRGKHRDKYMLWVGNKLNFLGDAEESLGFFMLIGFKGHFTLAGSGNNAKLIFYWSKGEEPKGFEAKAIEFS